MATIKRHGVIKLIKGYADGFPYGWVGEIDNILKTCFYREDDFGRRGNRDQTILIVLTTYRLREVNYRAYISEIKEPQNRLSHCTIRPKSIPKNRLQTAYSLFSVAFPVRFYVLLWDVVVVAHAALANVLWNLSAKVPQNWQKAANVA